MTLRRQQDILARLYTDNSFRSQFLSDPPSFAAALGISAAEAEGLAALAGDEVTWFSESLLSKRLREVRKMLPLTERAIGADRFAQFFRDFAAHSSPGSIKKHLEDALAFAANLSRDSSVDRSARSIARFESARLRHNAFEKFFSSCVLRYDPRTLLEDMAGSGRRGIGIWIAVGGRSRVFFLAGGKRVSG